MWYDYAHLLVALIHVRDLTLFAITLVSACGCGLLALGVIIGLLAYASSFLLACLKDALIEAYEAVKG